jgi:DNA-binding response OmpR family regulator
MVRILVLEDDLDIREALATFLELENYEVLSSNDLVEGLRLVQQGSVDLVLTDLFAQRFTREALSPIQALAGEAPETPIVLTTACAEAAELDPAVVGLADIITKPFEIDEFLARVRRVIAERQGHAQASQAATTEAA